MALELTSRSTVLFSRVVGGWLALWGGQQTIQQVDQPSGVIAEAAVAQLERLPPRQPDQARWEFFSGWHCDPVDQHRDDPDVAFQRRLDLQPDQVVGVIELAAALSVGAVQPLVPNQRQQHVARPDGGRDRLGEVQAGLDGVDVHKHALVAEVVRQPVPDPAYHVAGVLAPVAEEDPPGYRRNGIGHPPSTLNHHPRVTASYDVRWPSQP
jgi:hypothetical protein